MRIGISTGAFYGQQETEEAAARLASLAPSCAEVFLQSYSEYSAGFARLVRERLGGVPAVSVHAILHHFECGLYSFSARQREESFAWLTRFLDAAQALDVGVYVYHGPARHRGAGVPPVERWRPGVERVLQMCQARGISLAWETVSWCWLCSLESLRALRKAFPRLRFTLDTKQLFTLGLDRWTLSTPWETAFAMCIFSTMTSRAGTRFRARGCMTSPSWPAPWNRTGTGAISSLSPTG